MLWLLPRDAGPVRVRLDPDVYVVPHWYDEAEVGVLLELLRRLLQPAVDYALVLPVDAMGSAAWAKLAPSGSVLVAVRGQVEHEPRVALGRWAREHRYHVLVAAQADDGELPTGWLEGEIKPAVLWLLERGVWVDEHPLSVFGIEGMNPDALARATEDPVEMMWLLERTLRHRLQYAEHGLGEQGYARSLGHAVGERCAEKLRRHGQGVMAALDVVVGAAGSTASRDGMSALVGAGLGVWRDGAFERGPLLRVAEEDWAVVEVVIGQLGEEVLSAEAREVVRLRRQPGETHVPSQRVTMRNDAASSALDSGLVAALRKGLGEVQEPPMLLGEALDAIERWGEMHWSEERTETLRELRLRLRGLTDAPFSTHRQFATLVSQVLAVLTARGSEGLAEARAADHALWAMPERLEGWALDVRLHVTLECAKQHLFLAANADDLRQAEELLLSVVALARESERPWQVAEAQLHLASIAMRRGDFDAALEALRSKVLPAVESWGNAQAMATTMGQIADILEARGDFDQALHIRQHDQLPIYERLEDTRGTALTRGAIADISYDKGDLDQALHIRQHDELPVYERLGDVRSKAIVLAKIADIFYARGDLEDAHRILHDDVLPIFERLQDVRSMAITMGRIAHILHAKGDIDQALHIRQHDELPVHERLGDARERANTLVNIAILRLEQADDDSCADAVRMLSEAHRAFTRMRLPDAQDILEILADHDLDLEAGALARTPENSHE